MVNSQKWIMIFVTMALSFLDGLLFETLKSKCYRCDQRSDCTELSNTRIEVCRESRKSCYALVENTTKGFVLRSSGCFPSCVVGCFQPKSADAFMCCCENNLCNGDINALIKIKKPTATTTVPVITRPGNSKSHGATGTIIYIVTPIFGFVIVVAVLFKLWSKHKRMQARRAHLFSRSPPSTPPIQSKTIQMHDIVSRGQFGYVWRACYEHKMVAVKVIPPHERMSWETERKMYDGFQLRHESILNFHSAEKRSEDGMLQYWIITEYHEEGSLADYLHKTVVDFQSLLTLVLGMASGLAYLHGEDTSSSVTKPIIAHRDFKSRNLLVKSNRTCCIGDFGSACSFGDSYEPDEAKAQVGTKRYMAPEVLEGAVAFQAEAFLCIDVYALALVMWEVLSRCDASSAPVEEYCSPFEDEVGLRPTMEDMRACVLDRKARPLIKPEWLQVEKIAHLCDTIEDCWDDDADARLTAHCVLERITQLSRRESDAKSLPDWMEDEDYGVNTQLVDLSASEEKIDFSSESSF